MALSPDHKKWYRAAMLRLLAVNQASQYPAFNHVELGLVMRGAGCGVGELDVLELLTFLCDRGWVRYKQIRNKLTNDREISEIEVTSVGLDIIEKTKTDASVVL